MNIYGYKAQFEAAMQTAVSLPLGAAEQAWHYFKQSLQNGLDEDYCDEIGFVVGTPKHFIGATMHYDENLFEVYFGRTLDNVNRRPWDVAEIDCTFSYEMNEGLRLLAEELRATEHQIEVGYCKADAEETIREKIDAVIIFADEKRVLWDTIRELTPTKVDTHFWLY